MALEEPCRRVKVDDIARLQRVILGLVLAGLLASPSRAGGSRQKVALTLGLAGAAAGAYWLDGPARRPAGNGEYAGSPGFFAGRDSLADRLGQPLTQFGLAAGFYGHGLMADSERSRRIGAIGAVALSANGLATWGLKTAAGRRRPFLDDGNGVWRNGSGYENSSFPSGHTSMAFTMASVVAEEYESPWVDGAAYGMAGLVGASRIHQDQHWLSDVACGALLGVAIGKGVSRWERRSGWARSVYTDGRGLYLRMSF